MKKDGRDMKYVNYLCVWCLAMVLFACQEESLEQSGKTGFLVSLTDGTEVAVSRATPGELKESLPIEAKDFDLTITGSSTGETAYSGKVSEGLIPVKAGVYNLTATYGENPVLALDAPYFKGEMEKAIVKGGETTSVEIPCKVANSLLSVTFDNSKESFEDIYSDYSVEVKVGEESVTLKKDGKESAYFRADSGIEVIFHGTLKEDGEKKFVSLDLSGIKELPLQAGDHLKLTLMPELDKYEIPLSVEAAEVVTVTLEETIPVSWLPKPKVSAEGFDENNTLTFVETEAKTAKLNLGLSSALQDMKLKFNFEDKQFSSLLKDKEYLLSNAEDKAAVEAALGITLPEIGVTEAGIDLSGVVSRMQTDAGATVNNTIEVDVKANDRWSSEDESANRVYKLVCNKPEFSVNVKPENCWSWEFTVDEASVTAGDAEKIKDDLAYQYYDGSEWKDLTDGLTQKFTKDENRKYVYLEDTPEERSYKVRALYRGAIASEEVTATLEEPWQLPNSDMEDWSIETLSLASSYYHYNPYGSDDAEWWTTNNNRAADPPVAAVEANSCPAVSYVIGRNGGRAAELRTTAGSHYAHTNGVWGLGAILYSNGIVPGMLFIGNYAWNDHKTEIITPGQAFGSRPTDLEFYYKYQPLNSDEFKAYVEVWNVTDGQTTKLAEGTFAKTSNSVDTDFQSERVHLNYTRQDMSATHIYVHFWSTTKTSFSDNDVKKNAIVNLVDVSDEWKAHIGSRLQIDDISLVYDK